MAKIPTIIDNRNGNTVLNTLNQLLRIFEVKLKREDEFKQLRKLFTHEAAKDNNETH